MLSVNINKVATLRNTRPLDFPNVVRSAVASLDAGAYGVTVHPRPDERHIRPGDVRDLARLFQDAKYKHAEFNIEGNPLDDSGMFLALVHEVSPHQCTLVPDLPDQATSDHGWNLTSDGDKLKPIIARLNERGIRVSLFMDADNIDGLRLVPETGAARIELYTEPYAAAFAEAFATQDGLTAAVIDAGKRAEFERVLRSFSKAARLAGELGLGINAGHDLNLENLGPFLENVPNVLEVSIGHALIAEAVFRGLKATVHAYLDVIANVKKE